MTEEDTRDIAVQNRTDIAHLKEDVHEIKDYLKKHVKGIYAFLIFITATLLISGVIKPGDIKLILAALF